MQIDFSKPHSGIGSVPVTVEILAGDKIACPTTYDGLPVPTRALLGARQSALSDIILPRLNLVHSVGILKDSFPPGAYVHAQQLVLSTPAVVNAKTSTLEKAGSPPLIVTFIDLRPKRYFEKVPGGGRGLICDSLEEVARVPGTINWKEWKLKEKDGMKKFDVGVDCLLAIERPELVADDDTVFVFPVDDKKYALCLFNMKGAAGYSELQRTVLTDQHFGCLRDGTATHSYALSSRLKPTPDKTNTYWASVLLPSKPSTPAFREFAASVLGAPQVDSPEAE